MGVASGKIQKFVDWKCRDLFHDPDVDICTDEERLVFQECFDLYPEGMQPSSRACLERIKKEEIEKARGKSKVDRALMMRSSRTRGLALYLSRLPRCSSYVLR
jgi:hypothetical protein